MVFAVVMFAFDNDAGGSEADDEEETVFVVGESADSEIPASHADAIEGDFMSSLATTSSSATRGGDSRGSGCVLMA
jgi:hypothetical protein